MNDYASYRDYLRPKGLTWIKATLRVVVAVQCLGAAAQRLSAGTISPVADFLMAELSWAEGQAGRLDDLVAYGLLISGILIALRPSWPVLLPVTVWFIAAAMLPVIRESGPRSAFAVMEHGVRFLSPLALLILDFWPPSLKSHLGRTVVSMWLLRVAVAATFSGMGLLAIAHSVSSGSSLSLLQAVMEQSAGLQLADVAARCWLGALGGMSIGLAINVLVTRSKPILICTAVWGFVSAISRMIELGPAGYPETLVRFGELGVPVVLFLYFSLSIKEFPPEVVAEN